VTILQPMAVFWWRGGVVVIGRVKQVVWPSRQEIENIPFNATKEF
jgi:hypothetical protein